MGSVSTVIAVGSDVRFAADAVGEDVGRYVSRVGGAAFDRFIERIVALPVAEAVREFQISYSDAELLVPGLLMYRLFLDQTAADEVIVARVSMREGVLVSNGATAGGPPGELRPQKIANAISLGRRYRFDERHARHVALLACRLFDELQTDHGLGAPQRVLLEMSAILHDIGMAIRASGHHKHGHYIVSNSEIFGLTARDQAIVANVVRYHRRALPSPSHQSYMALARADRLVVTKLAALLRVADALDRSHQARVRDLKVETGPDEAIIYCDYGGNLALKTLALERKADLFQEALGRRVRLERLG